MLLLEMLLRYLSSPMEMPLRYLSSPMEMAMLPVVPIRRIRDDNRFSMEFRLEKYNYDILFYFIYAGSHVLNMLYNYIPDAERLSKGGKCVRRYCARISRQVGLPAIIIPRQRI